MMTSIRHLHLNPLKRQPLLKDQPAPDEDGPKLPVKKIHTNPQGSEGNEDASIYFIGTATTVIEWQGLRILTDPNFLHAGDHVHLGPGVTAQRKTDPAVDLRELPAIDCILLSHYHEDHFDRLVEDSLNRSFDIITTPHAKTCLAGGSKADPFRRVHDLGFFESMMLHVDRKDTPPLHAGGHGKAPVVKVTGMPGKHVPPGPLAAANDLLKAVPPTNGWLLELGYSSTAATGRDGNGNGNGNGDIINVGYRVYISGDTLFVNELKGIPKWLKNEKVDLMLAHLGGTTIPGPALPLVMVTMDAKQGVKLMRLINPGVTIPIHYDDYSVFLSPLADFKEKVEEEGWDDRVVYLDRGEEYRFKVRGN
ncbi:Metallo-hydrolase/oxidoreductase [Daldinia caldariorum]|uniref:Metallo-hydrolase/oxidoreductase n=1 Tax=Daldinia caldariorum TaxID=326644 RepID=UPI00200856B3|nr:Metallo-hydrolase/oxidoreductase [Daldinia caldariorum]KAI1470184.1 Metallo-hydrolase/oxidoreductase [Daldinia caldariorum]